MKTDIEIARETKLNKIEDIAEKLGVPRDEVQNYGRYIAKVPIHLIDKKEMDKHNLILVSAITPNKAGVGKTTVSIGLLRHEGRRSRRRLFAGAADGKH